MATRTCFAGTATNTTLSAANLNNGPGGLIGRATTTSAQGSLTTPADLTSLTLTLTPGASRDLRIVGKIRLKSDAANEYGTLRIDKDGSTVDEVEVYCGNVAGNSVFVVAEYVDVSPTAASHTYKLKAGRGTGAAGTFSTDASATQIAGIYIYDIGATF